MDFNVIYDLIKSNPATYFAAGLVLGYFLRGLFGEGLSAKSRAKKPGRYQNLKQVAATVHTNTVVNVNEPSFDLAEATVKTMAARRYNQVKLEQPMAHET